MGTKAGATALSVQQIGELIECDFETGHLFWKARKSGPGVNGPVWNRRYAGKRIGEKLTTRGYRAIKTHGKEYAVHRVVWALKHGRWPHAIDHINRNKDDNRVVNLRETTPFLNNLNREDRVAASGIKGIRVSADGRVGWRAIAYMPDGSQTDLGVFGTAIEAIVAVKKAGGVFETVLNSLSES